MFGTGIENEQSDTELYREYRFEPKDLVRISPLIGMVCLKDEIANLNESNEYKGFGLIGSREFSEKDLEFVDFSDPRPEIGIELIDCKDFSKSKPETTVFSEPEPELDLIDFIDFSKLEPELIDFSDPEPKL